MRVVAVELTAHHSIPEPKTAYQLVNRPGMGLPFSSLRDPEGASSSRGTHSLLLLRFAISSFLLIQCIQYQVGKERDEARRDREGRRRGSWILNQEEWYCKQCILMSCLLQNEVRRESKNYFASIHSSRGIDARIASLFPDLI